MQDTIFWHINTVEVRMFRPLIVCVAAMVPLAACNDGPGTSIAINATDADSVMTMSDNGQSGQVALNVPGFSGTLKLPRVHLDGDDVDLNGAHLYPGSKVTGMTVDASSDEGVVHISFDSPGDPGTVRGWFRDKLSDVGFTLHDEGSGLAGTTDDQKPFRLDLSPAGDGQAKGTITVG
jgi:hypothetical protein